MDNVKVLDAKPPFELLNERLLEACQSVLGPQADDVDKHARFPRESIEALKSLKLLSGYVPEELGGYGLTMTQLAKLCEVMGQHCASTAMIFAMHQIQVACIVHHARSSEFFENYLKDLVKHQYLLASATTEIGTGGDIGKSICALEREGDNFKLTKQAPVISYALDSDAILVTSRSAPDAPGSDQVHTLVYRDKCELEPISTWDTLGFRGTCSEGFNLTSSGSFQQILPIPYGEIQVRTMQPVAHLLWGSLWLGLAIDAVRKARMAVRKAAKRDPDGVQMATMRLTEVDEQLFSMRGGLYSALTEYERMAALGNDDAFSRFDFVVQINNVKLRCSEMVIDIVGKAMGVAGISAYRNDSDLSLSRHLRDAHGTQLMVNNDRIRGFNAAIQMGLRAR